MKEKTLEFPPKLFEKELPFKGLQLVWERGKGFRLERKKVTIEFPPRLLVLRFKTKIKED
ncbi:hypothetical protein ES703_77429 [subsurface metagenome]